MKVHEVEAVRDEDMLEMTITRVRVRILRPDQVADLCAFLYCRIKFQSLAQRLNTLCIAICNYDFKAIEAVVLRDCSERKAYEA